MRRATRTPQLIDFILPFSSCFFTCLPQLSISWFCKWPRVMVSIMQPIYLLYQHLGNMCSIWVKMSVSSYDGSSILWQESDTRPRQNVQ